MKGLLKKRQPLQNIRGNGFPKLIVFDIDIGKCDYNKEIVR